MLPAAEVLAQIQDNVSHTRGRIWEVLWSDGFIGDPGAWDYLSFKPKGMFPGFDGFTHPCCNEEKAINTFANANMHNFRSGVIIAAKDVLVPGQPPNFTPTATEYEFYAAGMQGPSRGVENAQFRDPIELRVNYMEEEGFNPLLPEEMTVSRWHTNLGITVTRRTYVWSYPGFRDFIIYDYVFKNTGQVVSILTSERVPNPEAFQQTLEEVYIAVHSGISVSTKSQINFHSDLTAVQAGGFGWQPPYHDYYYLSDDRTLAFSYNYNGGAAPPAVRLVSCEGR